jgi:hypothetical protein
MVPRRAKLQKEIEMMKRFIKSAPPLLITESQEEFASLVSAMLEYIRPKGILEEILANDVIDATWHIIRLQRCQTAMINIAYRQALVKLLDEELGVADEFVAEKYADDWFRSRAGRDEVMQLLKRFGLDETSIEAEAIKLLGPELETLDRMLSSSEARRNKALHALSEVQASVAKRAREVSQGLIEAERGPEGEHSVAAE